LHWDHASNNRYFRNARFIVQKTEYEHAIAPIEGKKGYEADLVKQTEYEFVEGDVEIIPGISVVLAPGHSAGMQCVAVDTAAGPYIIAGDLVPLFENWEASPRIPNGSLEDMDAILKSLDKVSEIGGAILPGHDPRVFDKAVYPFQ
jgi:glyoxylase-like metal-dependent hydrolase (beta-lactamase superfamily II)